MRTRRNSSGSCGRGSCSQRHLFVGAPVVLVLVVMAACLWRSRGDTPAPPSLFSPQPTAVVVAPKGVELFAEARGNILMVTLINHTDKDVVVGPKMFSVIAGGKRYPADSIETVAQFPIRSVRREEGVSGTFQFRSIATLEGARLVFNSPGVERQFVLINRYEPRAPNYQPQVPALSPKEQRKLELEQEQARQALKEALQRQQGQPSK